jgi:predicted thioredoxin/glutaredoxin
MAIKLHKKPTMLCHKNSMSINKMYDAGENKGLLLKVANSKGKKILWTKAREFQCH